MLCRAGIWDLYFRENPVGPDFGRRTALYSDGQASCQKNDCAAHGSRSKKTHYPGPIRQISEWEFGFVRAELSVARG